MAKTEKEQRLRLFDKGNVACPICLTPFSRKEVAAGEIANLEHVPPKGLSSSSRPICVTCSECNKNAGSGIEQSAVILTRPPRVHVKLKGVSHSAELRHGDDGTLHIVVPYLRLPLHDYLNFNPMTDFEATFKLQDVRYASISWLKSAYLSVFTLLGEQGYLYAQSDGVSIVRQQIINPHLNLIERFGSEYEGEDSDDWIFLHRGKRPFWCVRIGKCLVVLPIGSDVSFYEDAEVVQPGGQISLTNGFFWKPVVLGENPVYGCSLTEGYSFSESLGPNPYSGRYRINLGDGATKDVILATHLDRRLAFLPVRLKGSLAQVNA